MHPIDLNYRALLEVTNVLNSQRDTDSLWRAIAGQIKQVVPWERAGITLYCPESAAAVQPLKAAENSLIELH